MTGRNDSLCEDRDFAGSGRGRLGGLKEQVQQSVNFLGLLSERYSRFQCIIAMAA